jgi:hypothetical protein
MKFDLQLPTLIACLLFSYCIRTPSSLSANEPAAAARSIHFVLEDEPFIAAIPENYPAIGDLHFAAVVRGFAPSLLSDATGSGNGALVPLSGDSLAQMATLDLSAAGARLRKLLNPSKGDRWHKFRSKLIDDYPAEVAPKDGAHVAFRGYLGNVVSTLQTAQRPSNISESWNLWTEAREMERVPLQEYALLAPSVEEAKQFAEDFLHTYDQGFVPWLRKFVEEQKADLQKSRNEAQAKLAEIDKKIAAASREVEGVEELGQLAISDLKVKRTLLKVELAGVMARISTIEQKLKESAQENWAVEVEYKLTELKVSADIDLASLAAQKKVLDEVIDAQRRLAGIANLRQERRPYANPIQAADKGLPRCDEILADLKPFELIDDSVVIRPLRFRAE